MQPKFNYYPFTYCTRLLKVFCVQNFIKTKQKKVSEQLSKASLIAAIMSKIVQNLVDVGLQFL